MNAIQAINEGNTESPHIGINIHREKTLGLDDNPAINGFTITDNGVGFHDNNMDSFNTAFSTYKINQGGKGLGRLTWLKAYDKIEVRSCFYDADEKKAYERSFDFTTGYDPNDVSILPVSGKKVGTSITLRGFSDPWKSEVPSDIDQLARRLCEHFILVLMDEDCPKITITDGAQTLSVNAVFKNNFRSQSNNSRFEIRGKEFSVISFRISEPRSSRNRIVYCADNRAVMTESLDKFLPNFSGRLVDDAGESFVYLAVVTGEYLNQRVNPARTDFVLSEQEVDDLAHENANTDLFDDEIRRSEIREGVLEFVQDDLSGIIKSINEVKLKKIESYIESDAPHYRILLKRYPEFIDRIPRDGTRNEIEFALHRELHAIEVELKREGNRILLEAAKLDDYDEYEERIGEFLNNQNEVGVAALAQYVAHRRIILDLFKKAISRDKKDEKYPLEKVVHHLIFPMRSDTDNILFSQQNLWILDERLNYHSFVASDVELKKIEDIGVENSRRRPDLTIFDKKIRLSESGQPLSSLTIVEFKRPMRDDYTDDDNPLSQVVDNINEIRNGVAKDADGRPIKIVANSIPVKCYIVCDITKRLRKQLMNWGAMEMPGQDGFYGYHPNHQFYYEVMDYDTVLQNAERRNRVLFDKLKLLGNE
tara:strand:+ start:344 stop:2293 length:1950 start_codon:yes stop_codon:yes gene_type:complete